MTNETTEQIIIKIKFITKDFVPDWSKPRDEAETKNKGLTNSQ